MQTDTVTTASHEWHAGTHDGQTVRDLMATHHFRGEHAVENTVTAALLASIAVLVCDLKPMGSGHVTTSAHIHERLSATHMHLLSTRQDGLVGRLAQAFLEMMPDAPRSSQTWLDVYGHALMHLTRSMEATGMLINVHVA